MKLSKILKGIAEINDAEDTEISSVEYDSRKVKEGSLFVAVKGYETDGHKYIDSAVKNGAAAILAQEKRECAVPLICVPDTRRALAAAGANFFGRSADRLKIIGVTGTNGKTTVTYLVKQILDLVGIKTGLIGTNKNMIGDKVLETGRTTPESLELQKLFAEMEKEGAPFEELEKMTLGSLRRAVQDGDAKNGSLMAGQIAGMITKEQTCKEMIDEMMEQAEKLLGR